MSTSEIAVGARIGFVGLGHMGGPMAVNLAAAGYDVRGYDPAEEARDAAAAAGVTIAESAADAARGAAAIITSLPSGTILLDVLAGSGGVLAAAEEGALLIDTSTVDVDEARTAAVEAQAAGLQALDAPVSGGVVGARAGTLAFMVGGPQDAFSRAAPIFDVLGARAVRCGESGAGEAVKLCNNLLLAIQQIGVAEAFALVGRLGVDPKAFHEVASVATGACWALDQNCPVPGPVPASPANRDYEPGFAVSLMNKDLSLALAAVERTGTHAELGRHAGEIYRHVSEEQGAGRDFSVVYRLIDDRSSPAA